MADEPHDTDDDPGIDPLVHLVRSSEARIVDRLEDPAKVDAQRNLLHAKKMEALGTLAGGVAHDLNNLLQAILGNGQLLHHALRDRPDLMDLVDEQIHAAGQAARLTRQLLQFGRRQPIRREPVDLNNAVEDLIGMLRRIIGKHVEIVTQLDPDLSPVDGDLGSLEQVLMNLVVNARDAVSAGGTITVRTEAVVRDDLAETYPGVHPGRFARLVVEDDGAGIDDEVLPHVFEPFFSTKEAGHGTGLGLAVVYGIVRDHGGWVEVRSDRGVGTTFEVYLPSSDAPVEEVTADRITIEGLQGDGERILLVEDEDAVRDLVADVLVSNGYEVHAVSDPVQALALHAEHVYDAVVTDLVMRGMSGVEMVERMRHAVPGQPAVFLSGYPPVGDDSTTIREWGCPLLLKPFSLRDLLSAVQQSLSSGAG